MAVRLLHVLFMSCCGVVLSKNLTQLKGLLYLAYYKPKTELYDSRIFPCRFNFSTVPVSLIFEIMHITDFVMETGILSLTGKITSSWIDENIGEQYIPSQHDEVTEMYLPEGYLWLPTITVYNSVKQFRMISDPTHKVRVKPNDLTSSIEWKTTLVTDIPCEVNVKYFPFDEQECEIVFTAWNYNLTEIYLYTKDEKLNMAKYELNEEWTLEAGAASNYSMDDRSYLKFKLKLKRKYLWFFISMVAPVILLSMITAYSNMIPVDSGERIVFLLTIFLGFAFYMDMVQRTLPKTSNPMPFISYYLTSMLYLNSFAVIINIFLMRVYNKDPESPVPLVVRCLIATLTWRWCCPKKIKPDRDAVQPIQTEYSNPVETITLQPMERIDWRTTGIALDILFFYVFSAMHITVSIAFLIPLSTGSIYAV